MSSDLDRRLEAHYRGAAQLRQRKQTRLAVTVRDAEGRYPDYDECPNTYYISFVDGYYPLRSAGKLRRRTLLRQSPSEPRITAHNVYDGRLGYVPLGTLIQPTWHDGYDGRPGQWWFEHVNMAPCLDSSSGSSSSLSSLSVSSGSSSSGSSGSSLFDRCRICQSGTAGVSGDTRLVTISGVSGAYQGASCGAFWDRSWTITRDGDVDGVTPLSWSCDSQFFSSTNPCADVPNRTLFRPGIFLYLFCVDGESASQWEFSFVCNVLMICGGTPCSAHYEKRIPLGQPIDCGDIGAIPFVSINPNCGGGTNMCGCEFAGSMLTVS